MDQVHLEHHLGDILGSVLKKIGLMLKSQILEKLHKKHNNLSFEDIEHLFEIFIKKMSNSLKMVKI